jgi:hypothetical protein
MNKGDSMKNPDLKRVKNTIEAHELNDHLDIVNYVSVWSNGNKIRKFTGQGEGSAWHNPKDGYRKMVAILVEVDE